ncbi:putative methyltransferase [Helianthus anomalus]
MGSRANGGATTTGNGSATVEKGAFLYHQKEMLSDCVRMDAYYNSVFNNKHHFIGKSMASAADGGGAGDGDDGNVNIIPLLRTLAKGAAVTLGGVLSITVISSTTVALFTLHKKVITNTNHSHVS